MSHPETPSEEPASSLVQQAVGGDRKAWEQLVAQMLERFRLLARAQLRQFPLVHWWEETDDVLQQAMLRLLRSFQRLKPETPRQLSMTMGHLIRWVLLDLARRYRRLQQIACPPGWAYRELADTETLPCWDRALPVPLSLAEWCEFHELVLSLPPSLREVFDLRWYAGMSERAAAGALGISVRTVRRRWQLAVRILGDRLAADPRPLLPGSKTT